MNEESGKLTVKTLGWAAIVSTLCLAGLLIARLAFGQQGQPLPVPKQENINCNTTSVAITCDTPGAVKLQPITGKTNWCFGDTLSMVADTLISTGKFTFTTNYSNCATKSGTHPAPAPWLLASWWTVTGVPAIPASGLGLSAVVKPSNAGAGKLTFHQMWCNIAPCSTNNIIETLVVDFNAISIVLNREKKQVSANSPCEITPAETQSSITITTIPAGFEAMVVLKIDKAEPPGALPPGSGSLSKQSPKKWFYQSFEEPLTELHPSDKVIFIGAELPNIGCTTSIIVYVQSAFKYLTSPAVITATGKGKGNQFIASIQLYPMQICPLIAA